MRIQGKSFVFQFISVVVIWLCGFWLGFKYPDYRSAQGSNDLVYSLPNPAISSKGEMFIHILKVNSKVVLLNASGYFLFGIPPVISGFYNGFVTSLELNRAASIIGWDEVFIASSAHSIELIAIWLGGAIGLRGINIAIVFFKGRQPGRIELLFILKWLIIALLVVVIAAYFESFISIR